MGGDEDSLTEGTRGKEMREGGRRDDEEQRTGEERWG